MTNLAKKQAGHLSESRRLFFGRFNPVAGRWGKAQIDGPALCLFMCRCLSEKAYIRKYIEDEFGYDLRRTCDEIRPTYHHLESCQETVPEAITAFLEGEEFEDVIRTVVSLGGDCDTLTCIAGAMGEAYYGVPEEMKEECDKRLPEELYDILCEFKEHIGE